jgi:hypothetical protein
MEILWVDKKSAWSEEGYNLMTENHLNQVIFKAKNDNVWINQ